MKENILYILYESGSVVAQLCPILCDSMVCAWNSPGKNTGVGGHSLLQGIFPTQGSNPGLLHCRQILYYLSYQRSHYMLKVIKIMLVLLTTLSPCVRCITINHNMCFTMGYYGMIEYRRPGHSRLPQKG